MLRNLVLALSLALAASVAKGLPQASSADSKSFAGSNLYFLHALPESEQKKYVETLAGWGVKVLRLWVRNHGVTDTGGECVKGSKNLASIPPLESTIGTYDTPVLDALDNTLKLLHDNGIKAIISPHNANSLLNNPLCDIYCKQYGSGDFYSSEEAKLDYDKRLEAILSYKSPNFGRPWKELEEVILAFNLQNEPMITLNDKLNANDPDDWLCGRANTIREQLGSSKIKVATGGIGGSHVCCDQEFNLLDKALKCENIDIFSVHSYMSEADQWAFFITGEKSVLKQAKDAGKAVMVEEWGVAANSTDSFDSQVKVFNDAGMGWLYWQVVPGLDGTQKGAPGDCGYDGFEIGLNSSKSDVKGAVTAANNAVAAQSFDWGLGN